MNCKEAQNLYKCCCILHDTIWLKDACVAQWSDGGSGMTRFWISFSTKTENAGVIITDAPNFADALSKTIDLGINPGPHTSVLAMALEGLVVPPEYLDRPLVGADIDAFKALPQHGVRSIPKADWSDERISTAN
jgi:hypothetical protein